MTLATILSFLAIFIVSNGNQILHLNQYDQKDLNMNWELISQTLDSSRKLIIASGLFTETTLMKVLSLRMSQLQVLTFSKYHFDRSTPISIPKTYNSPQYLTPKLLRTIFRSGYLPQLRELNLINTNIDDRHFEIDTYNLLQRQKLKIECLKLGSNYIGAKVFAYLSQYQYPNIKELDVSGTSLIEQQSIDSLLKIICYQKEASSCISTLQSLDISSTSIQKEGFIQLMRTINTTSLKYLNISNNNLHQTQQYHKGANLTAFQLLSQIDFTELLELQMNDMAIDKQVVSLFTKWRFPKLQNLILFANFIDDQTVAEWITYQNFPSLRRLILYNNFLTDSSLAHIRKQNFKLIELNVGFNQFTHQGIQQLTALSNPLQKLYLKNLKLQNQYFKGFLNIADLGEIRQLGFSGNNQIGDLFSYLPWDRMTQIEKLVLTDCNIKNSVSHLIQQEGPLALNLKLLLLNNTGLTSHQILGIIQNLYIIFPELQFIDLIQPYTESLNFSLLLRANISSKVVIDIGYVSFCKKQQKIELIQLSNLGVLVLATLKYDLSEFFEYPQHTIVNPNRKINKNITIPEALSESIAGQVLKVFDFSQLQLLTIKTSQQLQLLHAISAHHQIVQFVSLLSLVVLCDLEIPQTIKLLQNMRRCKLKQLKLSVLVDQNQNQHKEIMSLILILRQLEYLTFLSLNFMYKKVNKNKYNFNVYLNKLFYPFLETLQLSQSQLKAEEVGGIIHRHKYSLRNINFNNNQLQTSFTHILAANELVLTSLDLSFISFTIEQFVKLGFLNTLYLRNLKLAANNLTSNHIIALLNQSNKKYSFMPSLVTLLLNDNDIAQEGIKHLFQNGLPQLSYLKINRNSNPNYLNIILSYPTKLHQISAIGTDIYALSRSLSPAATRRVNYLSIATNDFQLSDFQVLGSLQYRKLVFSHIIIKEVYECELFLNLLKINRYAQKIALFIDNEKSGLNSSCLKQKVNQIQVGSEVEELLITDKHYTTFMPQFLQVLLHSPRYLKSLMLYRTKGPSEIFMALKQHRIQHIQVINIPQNYMDDRGFQSILKSPLQSLTFLDVSYNQITMQSFIKLKQRELPLVQQINFSGLLIGDQGMQILVSMKLPNLKRLFLMNCQITKLQYLTNGIFPNLVTLGLQRNKMNFKEIVGFLNSLNKNNWPKIQNISFKGITLVIAEYQQILGLATKFSLRIQLDHPYYLEHTNGAKY